MRTFIGCVNLAIATLLLTSPAWSQSPVKGKSKGERPQEGKLQPGDEAPNFRLKRLNADEEIELSSFRGQRPVVLVFGSYTWGPFRNQVGSLHEAYEKFHDRAEFLLVYIKEAHPVDGRVARYNEIAGIRIKQPTTLAAREEVAQTCSAKLSLKFPVIVDTIDNKTGEAYAAHPDRLYIVDSEGKIAYKGKPGPRGFDVAEMSAALDKLLAKTSE